MRLCLLALGLAILVRQPGDVPIRTAFRPNPDAQRIDIELTNLGDTVVTAWVVRIESPHRPPSFAGTDIVSRFAHDGAADILLLPNQPTLAISEPVENGPLHAVVPLAAVYDDGTAVGDRERIEEIFATRREVLAAYEQTLPGLERLSQDVTPQTLRAAAAALLAEPTPRYGGLLRTGLARNLELAAGAEDPARALDHVLASTRRMIEDLRAHSTRR
jgi:hypothetical protein